MRQPANTIEDMKKLLVGYRDNMRVEVETGIAPPDPTMSERRFPPPWSVEDIGAAFV